MKKSLLITLGIALLAGGVSIGYLFSQKQRIKSINSFADCVSAGFPVMESFPAQCRAGDRTFIDAPEVPLKDGNTQTQTNPNITVASPQPNAQVSSPLTITGQAKGTWYFEASFPVKLLDDNGNILAQAPAQAQSDWMTTNFVPFSVTLTFPTPTTSTGTLILEKDNPSGEPQFDDSISIPVNF